MPRQAKARQYLPIALESGARGTPGNPTAEIEHSLAQVELEDERSHLRIEMKWERAASSLAMPVWLGAEGRRSLVYAW